MKHAIILAATSALGRAIAAGLAGQGYALSLLGRSEVELSRLKNDLSSRAPVSIVTRTYDVETPPMPIHELIAILEKEQGPATHFFALPGMLANDALYDPEHLMTVTQVNFTGPAICIAAMAQAMQQRKSGAIVVISSVAGDRGRKSNYVYGAAKAALTVFADGLRNRLHTDGVHVMTVKPGFMRSPMTAGMKSLLMVSPDYVAGRVLAAMEKKKNSIYVPWFWRFIMLAIRAIPESLFKRLSL